MKRIGFPCLLLCAVAAGWSATSERTPADAAQVRLADGAAMTFQIYRDKADEFRWRLKAANGQIVATSGQGYTTKANCRHEIEQIKKNASQAEIDDSSAK
jgi:uncharacterized protein YegP (UPF0339 family)